MLNLLKRLKVSSQILMILVLATMFITPSYAHSSHYTLNSWRMVNPIVYFYSQYGSHNWSSNVAAAAGYWNTATLNLRPITKYNSSVHYGYNVIIESANYGNVTWNGRAYSSGYMQLNDYRSSALAKKTSIASHEFGHLLGLDHTSCTFEIMYSPTKATGDPYYGDIAGFYAIYGK